jgi:hypothetical protein
MRQAAGRAAQHDGAEWQRREGALALTNNAWAHLHEISEKYKEPTSALGLACASAATWFSTPSHSTSLTNVSFETAETPTAQATLSAPAIGSKMEALFVTSPT